MAQTNQVSACEPAGRAAVQDQPVYDRTELEAVFLPVEQMLQLDRVTEVNGKQIVCETDVFRHWVFPMHFPADPVFPGSLLIEAAGQAVAIWAWHAGFRGRPRMVKVKAKFEHPVIPEDQVVKLTATIRQRKNVFSGIVDLFATGRQVARIEPTVIILANQPSLPGVGSD